LKDWIDTQNKLTNRTDGDKEWRKVGLHILHILHEIWLDRNNQLYGNEQTALDRRKESIIRPILTRIYTLQNLVPNQDRIFFERTIDEILEFPTTYLETWIKRHEMYLQKAADRESRRIKLSNTAITHFFHEIISNQESHLGNKHTPNIKTKR
jgi:hypothetical protein